MTDTTTAGALLDEACRRSGMIWLQFSDGSAPRPAWFVWREGSAWVVHGPGEQPLPGLDSSADVEVIVPSKDSGARLLRWTAAVSVLTPGSDEWQAAVPELAAKRLNALDRPGQPARWAAHCSVVRLAPTGVMAEQPALDGARATLSPDSHATAPVPSSATTRGPLPWVLGRGLGRWFSRRRRTQRATTTSRGSGTTTSTGASQAE